MPRGIIKDVKRTHIYINTLGIIYKLTEIDLKEEKEIMSWVEDIKSKDENYATDNETVQVKRNSE